MADIDTSTAAVAAEAEGTWDAQDAAWADRCASLTARVAELSALLGRAVNGIWLASDTERARAALAGEGGE